MLQGTLVLGDGEDAELDRQVRACDHGEDAWNAARRGGVDREDAGVRMRAAQDLAVQGPGQEHVVGVNGAPRHLGHGVDFGEGLAYNFHALLSAASWIASRILT